MKNIFFIALGFVIISSCATEGDQLKGPTQTAQKQEENSPYSNSNKVDSADDYPLNEEVRAQYRGY